MYKVPAQALRKSQKVERLYETKCKLSAKSARYFEQHFGYLPMMNTNIEKFYDFNIKYLCTIHLSIALMQR